MGPKGAVLRQRKILHFLFLKGFECKNTLEKKCLSTTPRRVAGLLSGTMCKNGHER